MYPSTPPRQGAREPQERHRRVGGIQRRDLRLMPRNPRNYRRQHLVVQCVKHKRHPDEQQERRQHDRGRRPRLAEKPPRLRGRG
eukprot:1195335-Prorocentrum_minimum.AAC.16